MPGIINSAPDCVTHVGEANADDIADFILQGNYQDCAGFMTFGPGSTYGEEGAAAATSYYVLIGIGGVVMVAVFLLWVLAENRKIVGGDSRQLIYVPMEDKRSTSSAASAPLLTPDVLSPAVNADATNETGRQSRGTRPTREEDRR